MTVRDMQVDGVHILTLGVLTRLVSWQSDASNQSHGSQMILLMSFSTTAIPFHLFILNLMVTASTFRSLALFLIALLSCNSWSDWLPLLVNVKALYDLYTGGIVLHGISC